MRSVMDVSYGLNIENLKDRFKKPCQMHKAIRKAPPHAHMDQNRSSMGYISR
ncbi:hypothetical protein HanRHA438_Chr11g0498301 [Helianthus annuus]|nr:hypothetical protein HanRHA438_Chr11g0498301 [Helianthus annuus]